MFVSGVKGDVTRLSSSFVAYDCVFFRIELDVIKEFTEDDKVTTWYQANISPKALNQTLHTTKVNLLARLPNFQNPNCNPFLRIFFKLQKFVNRRVFSCLLCCLDLLLRTGSAIYIIFTIWWQLSLFEI